MQDGGGQCRGSGRKDSQVGAEAWEYGGIRPAKRVADRRDSPPSRSVSVQPAGRSASPVLESPSPLSLSTAPACDLAAPSPPAPFGCSGDPS